MEDILKLETVDQYNKFYGLETLHPMVSVVDLSKAHPVRHVRMNLGFYALFLKQLKCGDMIYGRRYYDYQEGTVVSTAPGQVLGVEDTTGELFQPKALGLLFHPDFIRGTSLGQNISSYTFFSYEVNEALHLSEQERLIVIDCLNKIQLELQHAIDKHSKRLITMNIELLLDYCMRFYERQFITRGEVNSDTLMKFEHLLNEYLSSEKARAEGLPTVKYFADKVYLSPNYFGDLIKKETGKSAQEYIQLKMMDVAKELILDTSKTVSQIAYEMGFQYPQHFVRVFKKRVGCTPGEYRLQSS